MPADLASVTPPPDGPIRSMGNRPVTEVRRALAKDGIYVTLGGPGRRIAEALDERLARGKVVLMP